VNSAEARAILAMILGYWSTPTLPEEEAAAFLRELASASMRITPEEAWAVIDELKLTPEGRYRPRPGQFVAAVQALRRFRRLTTIRPMLPEAPVGFEADPEAFCEGIAAAKRANRSTGERPRVTTTP
jgi:hypothetical protein